MDDHGNDLDILFKGHTEFFKSNFDTEKLKFVSLLVNIDIIEFIINQYL